MSVPYVVILSRDATKFLSRISNSDAAAIESALDDLSRDQAAALHVKKLKGVEGQYRKRVGNFRILFEIADDRQQIYVFDIADRKDAYSA